MPVGDAVIKCRVRRAVSDYINHHRDDAVAELDFYRAMPVLRHVIKAADLARTADGGKHSHQWRIPSNVLREFGSSLSSRERDLREALSFDELHRFVREVGDRVPGIGVLAVYDTALRIGAKRDLLPTPVYLHRGTMKGAGALGSTAVARSSPSRNCPSPSRTSNHTRSRTAFESSRNCCRAKSSSGPGAAGAVVGAVHAGPARRRVRPAKVPESAISSSED